MNNKGYEILNSINLDIGINEKEYNTDDTCYYPDTICECNIDNGCDCHINELDCSYRMGNR